MTATELQRALSCLGYRPGKLDGILGVQSRRALRAFAQREGMLDADSADLTSHLRDRYEQAQTDSHQRALDMEQFRRILAARGVKATEERLERFAWLPSAIAEGCLAASPQRQTSFLAQLFHESGGLHYMEEIADGTKYEGRRDLGNTQRGDGSRYKGRGPIQLTGRANYRRYGRLLGVDLEAQPELAAEPRLAFRVAVLYWTDNNLNAEADRAAMDPEAAFQAITRAINGGTNGLDDRRAWLGACWGVLA